jgi:hypothetical protein
VAKDKPTATACAARSLASTPVEQKKHIVYESGHIAPRKEVIRECLSWLDRYLGPLGK